MTVNLSHPPSSRLHRRMCLYNIVYIRGIFPEKNFKASKQFGSDQITLRGDTPETQRVMGMMKVGLMLV